MVGRRRTKIASRWWFEHQMKAESASLELQGQVATNLFKLAARELVIGPASRSIYYLD